MPNLSKLALKRRCTPGLLFSSCAFLVRIQLTKLLPWEVECGVLWSLKKSSKSCFKQTTAVWRQLQFEELWMGYVWYRAWDSFCWCSSYDIDSILVPVVLSVTQNSSRPSYSFCLPQVSPNINRNRNGWKEAHVLHWKLYACISKSTNKTIETHKHNQTDLKWEDPSDLHFDFAPSILVLTSYIICCFRGEGCILYACAPFSSNPTKKLSTILAPTQLSKLGLRVPTLLLL